MGKGKGYTFVPDPDFDDDVVRSEELIPGMMDAAVKAAEAAKDAAPVRLEHYKKSIRGVAGHRQDGIVVGRVLSDDFKAVWIENGTGPPAPTPAYAPLRRGAEQVIGNIR